MKDLVQKISDGKVRVTYRTPPKVGSYQLLDNRFKPKSDSSRRLIEIYRTVRVNAYDMADEEEQLMTFALYSRSGRVNRFQSYTGTGSKCELTD